MRLLWYGALALAVIALLPWALWTAIVVLSMFGVHP